MESEMSFDQIRMFDPHRRAVEGGKSGKKDGVEKQDVGRTDLARFSWGEASAPPRVPGCAKGDWFLTVVPSILLNTFAISEACY